MYMARKFLGKPQHLYVRILFWQAWAVRSYIGTSVYKKKTQLVYFEIVRINHKKCLLVSVQCCK